jgi:hypothetical protein
LNFQYLAGTYTDRIFTQLGLHFTRVRYKAMVIYPNPVLSHEGTTTRSEFNSELSEPEALDTYTVSFPADALERQLAAALRTEETMIQQRYDQGLITVDDREAKLAIVRRDYRLDYALAAYREWELSRDKGHSWTRFRVVGDPVREAVRWKIVLVSLGV